jgi:hypothetical protein
MLRRSTPPTPASAGCPPCDGLQLTTARDLLLVPGHGALETRVRPGTGAWRSLIIGETTHVEGREIQPFHVRRGRHQVVSEPDPLMRAPMLAHELRGAPCDLLRHRERAHAGQQAAYLPPPLRRSHAADDFGQADRADRNRPVSRRAASSQSCAAGMPRRFAMRTSLSTRITAQPCGPGAASARRTRGRKRCPRRELCQRNPGWRPDPRPGQLPPTCQYSDQ